MRCEIFDGIYLIGSGRFGYTHPLNCNVYAIVGNREVALIDAGCGFRTRGLLDSLENHGVTPDSVTLLLLTHADWDHARGASRIKSSTSCRVGIHSDGKSSVENESWIEVGANGSASISFEPVEVDFTLSDGDTVDLGGRTLHVIHTPGHSTDSVCFELNDGGKTILFSGDTIHAGGKPGIVTANTDFRVYRESVSRLAARKIDALLPGHGIFVLEQAGEQIQHLLERLSSKWVDLGAVPYPPPFDSGAWFSHAHPELLVDD